jgi:hypothetical protein
MAQINMNGKSSLLNDIKKVVRGGGNVSHILNVKVSNERTPEEGNRIRAALFHALNNVTHTLDVGGAIISITWNISATTSAHFLAHARFYNDEAVWAHTNILLVSLLNGLDNQFGNTFSNGTTGVAFIVTKPLTKKVVLFVDDVQHLRKSPKILAVNIDEVAENQ